MNLKIPRRYGKLAPGTYKAIIDRVTLHRDGRVTVRSGNVEKTPSLQERRHRKFGSLRPLIGKRVVVQIKRKEE